MGCAKYLPGLLDGVLGLASHKQRSQCNVLIVIFVAREPYAKFMVIYRRRVKRLHRPAERVSSAFLGQGDGQVDNDIQLQTLSNAVNQLDALQPIAVFAGLVVANALQHLAQGLLRAVLRWYRREARGRPDRIGVVRGWPIARRSRRVHRLQHHPCSREREQQVSDSRAGRSWAARVYRPKSDARGRAQANQVSE